MSSFRTGSRRAGRRRRDPEDRAGTRDRRAPRTVAGAAVAVIVASWLVAACGTVASFIPGGTRAPTPGDSTGAPSASALPAPSLDTTPVTLTVWDYYGSADTPFTPGAIADFEERYPWITVDRRDLDRATFVRRLRAADASGDGPDVATLDMAWMPELAPGGSSSTCRPRAAGSSTAAPSRTSTRPARSRRCRTAAGT